jgi:hypothetical protein
MEVDPCVADESHPAMGVAFGDRVASSLLPRVGSLASLGEKVFQIR